MTEIKNGDVVRYCKRATLDENNIPTSASFKRRDSENSISVFLLNYFGNIPQRDGISLVKDEMRKRNLAVKKSGRFAMLGIQQSKEYVKKKSSQEISYIDENLPHCGIFHDADDLLISELLAQCVQISYAVGEFE